MSDRSARLGAAMLVCGLVREPADAALRALEDVPLLTGEQWEAWRDLDQQDIALLWACLEVEFEIRGREWEALDRLGVALALGDGIAAQLIALSALVDLGWDRSVQPVTPGAGS